MEEACHFKIKHQGYRNMKIALIVVGVIVIVAVAIEFIGRAVAKKEDARFKAMSPEEQRKHQEQMYKAKYFSDAQSF
jgi:hypothetical protein